MKYIAKKVKDGFEISGIQELPTPTGEKVEVIVDSKVYQLDTLKKNLEAIESEKVLYIEQYDNTIKDIKAMIEAIKA